MPQEGTGCNCSCFCSFQLELAQLARARAARGPRIKPRSSCNRASMKTANTAGEAMSDRLQRSEELLKDVQLGDSPHIRGSFARSMLSVACATIASSASMMDRTLLPRMRALSTHSHALGCKSNLRRPLTEKQSS
jgi:hypothetical protein